MSAFLPSTDRQFNSLAGGCFFACVVLSSAAWTHAAEDLPPLMTLRKQTRDLLRHEATLDAGKAKDHAVTALCDLYVVLRSDQRYPNSEMLQGDAAKIRRRLIAISRKRTNELKRNRVPRPSGLASQVDQAIAAALQRAGGANDPPSPGAAGGGALDNAWQLVELIQRIVEPDFWDRQGGPGSIKYFAMRRVLVVRATTDVHEQIKDLLTALR